VGGRSGSVPDVRVWRVGGEEAARKEPSGGWVAGSWQSGSLATRHRPGIGVAFGELWAELAEACGMCSCCVIDKPCGSWHGGGCGDAASAASLVPWLRLDSTPAKLEAGAEAEVILWLTNPRLMPALVRLSDACPSDAALLSPMGFASQGEVALPAREEVDVDVDIGGGGGGSRMQGADDAALVLDRVQNTVAVRGQVTPVAAGNVKSVVRMHVTYSDGSEIGGTGGSTVEAWWIDVELQIGVAQDML
jgi:hypothetical protein